VFLKSKGAFNKSIDEKRGNFGKGSKRDNKRNKLWGIPDQ